MPCSPNYWPTWLPCRWSRSDRKSNGIISACWAFSRVAVLFLHNAWLCPVTCVFRPSLAAKLTDEVIEGSRTHRDPACQTGKQHRSRCTVAKENDPGLRSPCTAGTEQAVTGADRIKWDKRHRAKSSEVMSPPSEFIQSWIDRCPRGRALDVACGRGRNALYLAASGYEVDAVDISTEALSSARRFAQRSGLKLKWIVHDLDEPFCPDSSYDLIVMVHYVNLPLLALLSGLLKPGGILLCEQHLATDAEVAGPSDPAFQA